MWDRISSNVGCGDWSQISGSRWLYDIFGPTSPLPSCVLPQQGPEPAQVLDIVHDSKVLVLICGNNYFPSTFVTRIYRREISSARSVFNGMMNSSTRSQE
jgi:hypothetical protein